MVKQVNNSNAINKMLQFKKKKKIVKGQNSYKTDKILVTVLGYIKWTFKKN